MESLTLIKIITFFYILFNSGRVFSYIPQIFAVFKEKSPVLAISLITWSFWTAANLTTALYATFVLPDTLLAVMSYGNTLGCAIVVFMVIYKRYQYDYWPKSKRIEIFPESNVTAFTEVPNLNTEEIYHFFHISDHSDESHEVTFEKTFKHEPIESFQHFLEMSKFINLEETKLVDTVIESETPISDEKTEIVEPILETSKNVEIVQPLLMIEKPTLKNTRKKIKDNSSLVVQNNEPKISIIKTEIPVINDSIVTEPVIATPLAKVKKARKKKST